MSHFFHMSYQKLWISDGAGAIFEAMEHGNPHEAMNQMLLAIGIKKKKGKVGVAKWRRRSVTEMKGSLTKRGAKEESKILLNALGYLQRHMFANNYAHGERTRSYFGLWRCRPARIHLPRRGHNSSGPGQTNLKLNGSN